MLLVLLLPLLSSFFSLAFLYWPNRIPLPLLMFTPDVPAFLPKPHRVPVLVITQALAALLVETAQVSRASPVCQCSVEPCNCFCLDILSFQGCPCPCPCAFLVLVTVTLTVSLLLPLPSLLPLSSLYVILTLEYLWAGGLWWCGERHTWFSQTVQSVSVMMLPSAGEQSRCVCYTAFVSQPYHA